MGPICPNCNSPEYYEVDVVAHADRGLEFVSSGGYCIDCGGLQESFVAQ